MLGRIISRNNGDLSHNKLGYDSSLLIFTQSFRNNFFAQTLLSLPVGKTVLFENLQDRFSVEIPISYVSLYLWLIIERLIKQSA